MTRYYIDEAGNRQVDRRCGEERRKQADRRDDIRFEPAKQDRRSGRDRRKALTGGWNDIPKKK